MHNESHTAGAEQVSQDTLEAICKLTLSGPTPEAISLALDLNIQTVIQVIARGDFGSKNLDQEGKQQLVSVVLVAVDEGRDWVEGF
jgi:hypothetical protein